MKSRDPLASILAAAMRADDPVAVVTKASRDRSLPSSLRRALAMIDANGLRMSALLVARLRFERLLNGSTAAGEAYDADAESFAREFRAYHREVPARASFPRDEARDWNAWRRNRGAHH